MELPTTARSLSTHLPITAVKRSAQYYNTVISVPGYHKEQHRVLTP